MNSITNKQLINISAPAVLATGAVVWGPFEARNTRSVTLQLATAGTGFANLYLEQANNLAGPWRRTSLYTTEGFSAFNGSGVAPSPVLVGHVYAKYVRLANGTATTGGSNLTGTLFLREDTQELPASSVILNASTQVVGQVVNTVSNSIGPSLTNTYVNTTQAGTNATLIRNGAARILRVMALNPSGSTKYLRIYNKGSTPVVGTDLAALVVPLLPGQYTQVDFTVVALNLSAGLSYAITGGSALTDNTAIALGDVTQLCIISI